MSEAKSPISTIFDSISSNISHAYRLRRPPRYRKTPPTPPRRMSNVEGAPPAPTTINTNTTTSPDPNAQPRPNTAGTELLLKSNRRDASDALKEAEKAERAYVTKRKASRARIDATEARNHLSAAKAEFVLAVRSGVKAARGLPALMREGGEKKGEKLKTLRETRRERAGEKAAERERMRVISREQAKAKEEAKEMAREEAKARVLAKEAQKNAEGVAAPAPAAAAALAGATVAATPVATAPVAAAAPVEGPVAPAA